MFESKQVDRNLSQCSSDQSRSTRQKDNELKTNNSWRYKVQRITLETSLPSLEFDFPQYMFCHSCPCVSCLKKICRDYSSFRRDYSCSLSFLMLQFEVIKKTTTTKKHLIKLSLKLSTAPFQAEQLWNCLYCESVFVPKKVWKIWLGQPLFKAIMISIFMIYQVSH